MPNEMTTYLSEIEKVRSSILERFVSRGSRMKELESFRGKRYLYLTLKHFKTIKETVCGIKPIILKRTHIAIIISVIFGQN